MQTETKKAAVFIDTDPGGDDVFALLWLASLVKQGQIELLGIATTHGNVAAEHTYAGAARLMQLVGLSEITVARAAGHSSGADDASYIHGADGMGGLAETLPPLTQSFEHAPLSHELIIETLKNRPGEVTLLAVGPLTNLARAEQESPGILKLAKEVVIMGGAFSHHGNVTPVAEFNIAFDPEAAATVLAARHDSVLMPLDITSQLIFEYDRAQEIIERNTEHPLALFLNDLTKFMAGTALKYRETHGKQGFLVHDAATVAYLAYPETLLMRRGQVAVECRGEFTRGQTVLDRRHGAKFAANAFIGEAVKSEELLAIMSEDFKMLFS